MVIVMAALGGAGYAMTESKEVLYVVLGIIGYVITLIAFAKVLEEWF